MSEKTLYCYQCEEYREARPDETAETACLHHIDFDVTVTHWICRTCGTTIDDESASLANFTRIEEAYCRKTGSISCSELRALLEKYRIGAASLSDLLGWGKLTVYRYAQGAIPSPEYGRRLKELLDPINMIKLLDQSKGNITPIVYKKSYAAALSAFGQQGCYYTANASEVCCYFIQLCERIGGGIVPTKLWMQKLLYFAQVWHISFFNAPLFLDPIKAWDMGPVVRSVWESMKKWSSKTNAPTKRIVRNCSSLEFSFSESQRHLLDTVFCTYGQFQPGKLAGLSHMDTAWSNHHSMTMQDETMPLWEIAEEYGAKRARFSIEKIEDIKKSVTI